jgi:Ca2+-binding EF-hand superfamily protein
MGIFPYEMINLCPHRLIRKFDADGSGKLEFDEFCALVYTVANSVDKETLRRELKEAFRLFDKEVNLGRE